MTSRDLEIEEHKEGATVFVPFWILLEYLDITPPDPFLRCVILNIYRRSYSSNNGNVTSLACDLDLGKDGLIAYAIPVDYLIKPSELVTWAERISNWFLEYSTNLR